MTHLQSRAATAVSSLAYSYAVTTGNLLIVAFGCEGLVDPLTVTDSVGTTFTKMNAVTGQSNNLAVYAGIAGGSGANTVTVAGGGTNFRGLVVSEFSGAGLPKDATATAYNSASPSSVSITTTLANDLLYAAQRGFHSGMTFSAGAGFTLVAQANGSDAIAAEYKTVATAGATTASIGLFGDFADNAPLVAVAFPAATPALCLPIGGLVAPTQGVAYSHLFIPLGGTSPFTFAISGGALPTGITLNTGTGAITGTPTTPGVYTFTLRVTAATAATASRSYTLSVSPTTGDLYRDGWTAYTNDPGGSDPANTIDASTATYWQPSAFPADLWWDLGASEHMNYLRLLPNSSTDVPGDVELYAGDDGATWTGPIAHASFASGSGSRTLSFDPIDKRWMKLHIVNKASGSTAVRIADVHLGYDSAIVGTLTVKAPNPIPTGTYLLPYNAALSITGGALPYSIGVHSGALPPGLMVSDHGVINGVPTQGGAFTATLRVTDDVGTMVDVTVAIAVFRPGDYTEGAVMTSLQFVWWTRMNNPSPEFMQVSLGSPANPPGSLFFGGSGRIYFDFGAWTTKQVQTFAIDVGDVTALHNCGITVADGIPDARTSNTEGGAVAWFGIVGTVFGDVMTEMFLYGCYYQAEFSDGSRAYSYPSIATESLGSSGDTENPQKAVDGSLDTFARVWRQHFSPLGVPSFLRITGFSDFTATPTAAQPLYKNFAY